MPEAAEPTLHLLGTNFRLPFGCPPSHAAGATFTRCLRVVGAAG